jgi:hypothetical protein
MSMQKSMITSVPGDPEEVRRISALLATVVARAQEIESRLRAIESGVGPQMWRGRAADAFAALLAETGPDLTALATSYGAASQSLATYATGLAAAQDMARAAQAEATAAAEARDLATADRDSARSDADRHAAATGDAQMRMDAIGAQDAEQRRADALQREKAASAAINQAELSLNAAQQKGDQAANDRNVAAAKCVRDLDDASRAGIETRNLAQPATTADTPQAVSAAAGPIGLRTLGNGTVVDQAAVDSINGGTGTALAGVTLAGAAHRVLEPAATSIVRSLAGAPVPIAPPPPPSAGPAGNAAWWKGLGPQPPRPGELSELQERVLRENPEWIGNRDGIPAFARDRVNRSLLAKEAARIDQELAAANARWQDAMQQPAGEEGKQVRPRMDVERLTKQRDALAAITATIGIDRQLLVLDLAGGAEPRAAVAVGDVDTADHVAVFAPGFTTTVAGSLGDYVRDMQALQETADKQLAGADRLDESVAAVAWLGYDAPQWNNVSDPHQSVVNNDAAQRGGTQLAGFLDGILASRPDDPHLTALGHSYGSTTTGYALQQVGGVDDAVLFGSPGASTGTIADLRVPPGHVAVLEARGDWIADTGLFGGDPNQLAGVTNLSAREATAPDGTPLDESLDHSEYLAPRTTSQFNIAATVAGLPDLRITGLNDGVGDAIGDLLRNPPQALGAG